MGAVNMKKTLTIFLTAALGASATFVHADAGSTAANFLKIGIGARGSAMGEAQSAVSDDVTAAYWNPAGLTNLRFQEISVMHYQMIEGIRYQQAGFGLPTNNRGTFAFGGSLLDYGSIQGYDNGGVPNGTLKATNLLLTGSWARRFGSDGLSAGATVKYLKSDLAGFGASAPMLDLGVLYPFRDGRLKGLRVAATIRNIGPDVKYDQTGSPLPRTMVLGGGFSALGGNLNVALDMVKPTDNSPYLATGLEYRLFDLLLLRVGYNGISEFVGNGITYGMGLRFRQWNLDYALIPFGDFGNTNRLSVGIRFGRALEMQKADDQIEFAYNRAQRQIALGRTMDAYATLTDLIQIAPWHKPSVELKAKIQKQYDEMSVSKNRARLEAEIADKFTEAKAAFDRDELVAAKKGFETILVLQPEHVGSTVYLERIQNRYASLADDSFKQGMAFFAAGDYPKAKMAFEKTLTINDAHADAKAQLEKTVQVMEDNTRREREMELLAGAAESYKAGLAAYQNNDFDTALAKFQEVQLNVPSYEEVGRYLDLTKKTLSGVLFEQAQVQAENGQLAEAVAKLKRADELTPGDQRVTTALTLAERDLGIKNAERSRSLYKEGLEAYLGGQTEKATSLWRRALELDSTNEDALQAISKLEEQKAYERSGGNDE